MCVADTTIARIDFVCLIRWNSAGATDALAAPLAEPLSFDEASWPLLIAGSILERCPAAVGECGAFIAGNWSRGEVDRAPIFGVEG